MRRVAPSFFVFLLLIGSLSHAQALREVGPISLVVEELSKSAEPCGISIDALDAAMRIPLSNSRLKVSGSSRPYLYANVNVIHPTATLCIAAVNLSFRRVLTAGFDGSAVVGTVWEDGALLSGPPVTFGRRVTEAIEDRTKLFIGAWLKENGS